MKKYIGIISVLAALFFGVVLAAQAQSNAFDIQFPIAELGGCGSMQECKIFCDDPVNGDACFAFAQARGLVKKEDVQKRNEEKQFERQRSQVLQKESGPGGCNSEESCREFCSDPANGEECLAFAKKHELRSPEELAKIESQIQHIRKSEEVVQEGNGPGGCNSPESCRAFCREPANRKICFEFAKEHKLIEEEELARIEKEGIERQTGPGGCASKEECDAFCRTPQNIQACLDFAVDKGQITAEQAAQFKQMQTRGALDRTRPQVRGPQIRGTQQPKIDEEKARQLLETTGGPGGCKSFEECSVFCGDQANEDVCFSFAKEHGLMSSDDADRIDRMRNVQGPGGCRGRQCEQVCGEQGREEECLNFAIDQGLIPPEEVEHAKKFIEIAKTGGPGGCKGRQCEDFCNRPENQEQCFAFAKEKGLLGQDEIQKIEKIQGTLKSGGGPGGCTSEQACRSYCTDTSHFEECAAFAVGVGLVKPEEAMTQLQQFVGAGQRGQQGQQGFGGSGGQGFGQGFQSGVSGEQRFGSPQQGGFDQGQQGFGAPGSQGSTNFGGQMDPQMQQQFEARFKQFEQFRTQFENGGQGAPGGQGGFPGQGQFPGQGTSGGFPGGGATGGTFPSGSSMPPGQAGNGTQNRGPMGTPRQPLGGQGVPGGMKPSDNGTGQGFGQQQFEQQMKDQFQNEFNKQFDQQANKQFEEEMKRQMMMQQQGGMQGQPGGFPPPGSQPGMMPPQGSGSFTQPMPSGMMEQPPSGSFMPPPGGEMMSPPPMMSSPPPSDGGGMMPPSGSGGMMPPPGAFGPLTQVFAAVFSALAQMLSR